VDTAANLAALMTDAGLRVLLVDLDVQPTLSSYFPLQSEAVGGILQFIVGQVFPYRALG